MQTDHELHFPAQPGPVSLDQLNDADREALRYLARNARVVVDVGTFLGASAETMLEAMPEDGLLITVDTFEGVEGSNTGAVSSDVMMSYAAQRLSHFGNRAKIFKAKSTDLAVTFNPGTVDLVFIDAAHDYESVKADILAWFPSLRPGGVMSGHDYDRRGKTPLTESEIMERSCLDWDRKSGVHCGVVRAVREMFDEIMVSDNDESSVWWTAV